MNFYAVRVGKTPGIYLTWPECQAQVNGFPNARYKKFSDRQAAEDFVNGIDATVSAKNTKKHAVRPELELDFDSPYAFVDGSYNKTTGVYGYGGFLVENGNTHVINGSGEKPELSAMTNVAGEICGVIKALQLAMELGLKELTIFYDYAGLEFWITGKWKAKKEYTQKYVRCVEFAKTKLNLKFIKVTAHTGIPGNEEADRLAKQAAGIM